MTWKHCFVVGCLGIILGAIGAWKLLPVPTRVETKTEVLERVVTRTAWKYVARKDTATKERRNVVIVERYLPGGEVSITTTDKTEVDTDIKETVTAAATSATDAIHSEKTHTVSEPKQERWYLGLNWRVYPAASAVPAEVEGKYRLAGPIWIGIAPGLDQHQQFTVKAALGVTF